MQQSAGGTNGQPPGAQANGGIRVMKTKEDVNLASLSQLTVTPLGVESTTV